jgi:hypothetical protein
MRKIVMLAIVAAICASGRISAQPPAEGRGSGGRRGGPMQNLTEEQKACVEAAACPQHEMKKPEGDLDGDRKKGEKPVMPEMTEEEKAEMEEARECRKKAFESCGIEMPERHEDGRRPRD